MSRSINKVQIIGTLGRDPEVKQLPNGTTVVTLSVATDESYNDKNTGQKVEKTEWHRLTAFGKLAEITGQYLKKGSKAYFEGKLRTYEYEKDGIKRYSTEIVINDMMMLDGKPDAGQKPEQGGFQPQNNQHQHQKQGEGGQQNGFNHQHPQNNQGQQGGFTPQQQQGQPQHGQQGGYPPQGQVGNSNFNQP